MYKKLISAGDINSIREFLSKAETYLCKPKVVKEGVRSLSTYDKVRNLDRFIKLFF
jgi:hypothetical protein